MSQKIAKSWKDKHVRQQVGAVLIVLVIAGLGVYLLRIGHAATPYATSEAETGTLSSSACLGTNSDDSNGSHVQFGDCTTAPNSASTIIMWQKCDSTDALTDAQLAAWKSEGIGGFTCVESPVGELWGMGGEGDEFTSNLSDSNLAGTSTNANYALERTLISTNIVTRAHAAHLKVYLGAYLSNYDNTATPLETWFDDTSWTTIAIPAFTNLAGAAHSLGFDGIALDSEIYSEGGPNGTVVTTANWNWNYAGNSQTQQTTNTEVAKRGTQIMTAILGAFPNVTILNYDTLMPGTWDSYSTDINKGTTNSFASSIAPAFWSGMTSVNGYNDIYFQDENFYKGSDLNSPTDVNDNELTDALQYNANAWYATASKDFSNWVYAADHVSESPSIWIDSGPGGTALTPAEADIIMPEYVKWAIDGQQTIYANAPVESYDYSPFYSLFEASAMPTNAESTSPTLTVSSPSTGSTSTANSTINMSGYSTDTFAVRDVKWTNLQTGKSGAALMTWVINSGSYGKSSVYNSQTNWTISDIPLQSGTNQITITAENIHNLTTSKVITVTH